jgi:hypothetical protein
MKTVYRILVIAVVVSLLATPVMAQTEQPPAILAPATQAVDPLIEYEVQQYLTANPPAGTTIYAITDVSSGDGGVYISVVGLNPDAQPPYNWSLEDGGSTVIWAGMLKKAGGELSLFVVDTTCHTCSRNDGGPGGGSDIYFPWQAGKQMLMGPRGIHGAGDYGTSGMLAIDWVSGDDFGGNAAGPTVYASAPGSIDYVCHDTENDKSTTVRITDGSTIIVYAHLIYNSSLVGGHSFARGQPIGTLKYGTFGSPSVGCGWAQQSANHYHLHWMFVPASGKYRTEGWQLTVGTTTWSRGNEKIKVNMWMTGGSGSGGQLPNPGQDDPPGGPGGTIIIDPENPENLRLSGLHFWDYVIGGLNTVFVTLVLNNLPASTVNQESNDQWTLAINITATMIRDANTILVNDTINFAPVILLFAVVFSIEIIMRAIGIAILILSLIKLIPFL